MTTTDNISRRDRQLAPISMTLGVLAWAIVGVVLVRLGGLAVILGLGATALLIVLVLFLSYLLAHVAFVSHLRGQGIEVTPEQLPHLHEQLEACCTTLGVSPTPRLFILNGNGVLNAFATWFLGHRYVILNSDVVDATESNPAGARFYVGHELGHIVRHDNPFKAFLRWPALRLPLLGAASSRARETTCDLHGLACCPDRESAARSVAVLAAGKRQWAALSMDGARRQALEGTGFWMSFHELVSSYPWTAKRTVRVLDEQPELPRRNPFAYLLAGLIPYAGQVGAGTALLIYIYVIGITAAIAIPKYQNQKILAQMTQADLATSPVKDELAAYYLRTHRVPNSLDDAGLDSRREVRDPKGESVQLLYTLQPSNMALTVHVGAAGKAGMLYVPHQNSDGTIHWSCGGLEGVPKEQIPPSCTP
jgi:Zn-dependent protease with chaperone function/type II secretory pathway pseudopilin PulG